MKVSYELTDNQLLFDLKEKAIIGSAFAFIRADFADDKKMRWLNTIFGPGVKTGGAVVSLLGQKPVDLPGAIVTGKEPPSLKLRSITADKMLYQTSRDSVHLMIFDPSCATREIMITVRLNTNEQSRLAVRLNENGQGALVLRDLDAGQYARPF